MTLGAGSRGSEPPNFGGESMLAFVVRGCSRLLGRASYAYRVAICGVVTVPNEISYYCESRRFWNNLGAESLSFLFYT